MILMNKAYSAIFHRLSVHSSDILFILSKKVFRQGSAISADFTENIDRSLSHDI